LQDEAGRWYVPDLQGRAQDLERLRERSHLHFAQAQVSSP
jgi:hypothetical protein